MAPTASKSGLTPAQQRERRSKILAIALSGLLVVVLVVQLPRLMKGHKATTAETAAPVASTASASSALPGASVSADAGSVPTGTPPPGQLTSFNEFAFKDPFFAQVGAAAVTTSSSSGSTPASKTSTTAASTPKAPSQPVKPAAKKPAKKTKTIKFKAKPKPPNAALIAWNGRQLLVPVGVSFPTTSPLFKLVTLGKKLIHIGVLSGSFTSGSPTLAVHPGQKVTLDNEADGSEYVFKLVKLVAASSAQIAAATSGATSGTSGASPAPSSGTGSPSSGSSGSQPAGTTTTSATTTTATTTAATTTTATTTTATTTTTGTTTSPLGYGR